MEMVLAQRTAISERDLILRAQAGESEAFGELVVKYMKRAYFAALGLVGSHEDALELSQEAFARAYRARQRIDPELPFYTWLYQILRRLCFNHIRDSQARRSKRGLAGEWLAAQASKRAAEVDPGRAAERTELSKRVQKAVERLTEKEREVVVLKEYEGLRYREIADLLGIPIGTVMSRLYSARRHLADLMEEKQ